MDKHDPLPTRGSLLLKIKDLGNESAWKEFHGFYGELVRRLALQAGLTESEADDVVQEVFISVTRNIGDFVYDPARSSFKNWLSQMIRWRIRDQLGKRLPSDDSASPEAGDPNAGVKGDTSIAAASDLDALWEAEWNQHLIQQASARVKLRVSARQWQMFFLHVLKELPAAEVVQRLKVSRAQVYLAKLRVSRIFRQELKQVRDALTLETNPLARLATGAKSAVQDTPGH